MYNKKFNPIYLSAAAVVGLLAVGGFYLASYIDELETRQAQPDNSEEVRNELESQIRLELAKSNLDELILNSAFDEPWENAVWNEFQNVSSLLPQADEWLLNTRATLGAMYIGEIDQALEQQVVDRLPGLLSNAARYITESALLEEKSGLYAALVDAIAQQEEADRIEAERLASQQQQQQQVAREAAARRSQFNIAYQNVEELLVCQNKLDMRDLEIAVNKLRSVDMARYRNVEKNIVTPLSSCITEIGLVFPDRATEIKRLAMRLFRGNTVLANTRIVPRDPCDKSLAGLGKQGKRAACRDKIKGIGNGPELVVIPARGSLPFFAVSKYEVSIQEFNQFCNATSQCKALTGRDSSLPVTGVSIKQVNEYISWLNKLTDKNYRLPTRVEWNYAARANSREMDPNRNCELSTRGIQKGGVLLKTEVGGSNAWGIVNHLGNAAELLKDKGNKLLIAGGSYSTPMQQCNFDNIQAYDGRASEVVGFRLLREI